MIEDKDLNGLRVEAVKKAFDSFLGEIGQVPPMVSAKKYKGKKLYELARRGESVPRSPCSIKIHEIEILNFNLPEIVYRVRCSKGTYVMKLCEYIGKTLGYTAHMTALTRTASGKFLLEEAYSLNDIREKNLQSI